MTFLKKFAAIALRVIDAITNMNFLQLLPATTAAKAAAAMDRLVNAIKILQTADAMFSAAGQEKAGSAKLKAVTPFIAALVHDAVNELKPGAKPKDEAAFEAACAGMSGNLADALNAYGD